MIDKIRYWIADRLGDIACLVEPQAQYAIEFDEADLYPWGTGIARSRAEVEAWFGRHTFVDVAIERRLDVDHVEARVICKALLAWLGMAVAVWGAAWLVAGVLHALGVVK